MFTGIITACQPIRFVDDNAGNRILTIATPAEWLLTIGESVSINGVCSTVIRTDNNSFSIEYMPETLRLTTMRFRKEGDMVNLERSMKLQDVLSGHIVSGHVDATGTIDHMSEDGESHMISVLHSPAYNKYIIQKGSITVNGISLTVVNPTEHGFSIALIPHTWEVTNMHALRDGDEVNLEYDVLAKYIEKLVPHANA